VWLLLQMFKENWRTILGLGVVTALLSFLSVLFYWSIDRLLKRKSPNSYGLHIVEDLPSQVSVKIGQPGNLYQLSEEVFFNKRLILDLNPMDEASRNFSLHLIKSAGKLGGCEMMYLGENIYAVQSSFIEYLPIKSGESKRA
jgi:hypothetical protein